MSPAAVRYERHFGERVIRCFERRSGSVWSLLEAAAHLHPRTEAIVDGPLRLAEHAGFTEFARQLLPLIKTQSNRLLLAAPWGVYP